MVGGVSVKKKQLTDKHYGKGSRGFYAALGISAVMVGAACLFAHKQGDSISQVRPPSAGNTIISQETAVNRRVTDIPRTTAPTYRTTTAAAARPKADLTQVTVHAAEITVDAPFKDNSFAEQTQSAAAGLSASDSPLDDISNVLNEFSSGELVKNETTGTWQTHNGTDIAAEVGENVYAVSDGEITAVDSDPLWGVTVVLDHNNGFITRYCGLGTDLAVKQGDKLSKGDVIGSVGETADIESSSAPHLHIEITHNGEYIDPMLVLGKG